MIFLCALVKLGGFKLLGRNAMFCWTQSREPIKRGQMRCRKTGHEPETDDEIHFRARVWFRVGLLCVGVLLPHRRNSATALPLAIRTVFVLHWDDLPRSPTCCSSELRSRADWPVSAAPVVCPLSGTPPPLSIGTLIRSKTSGTCRRDP